MNCFGYTMHKNQFFLPNTVLFSNEHESISVSMAIDAVDYILNFISATFDTSVNKYRTALSVFKGFKLILTNQTPPKRTKDMAKLTVEVMEEIANMTATSECEVQANARNALIVKMLIDGLGGGF